MSSLKFKTDGYLFIKDFFSDYQVQVLKELTNKLEENCSKIMKAEDAGFSVPNEVIIIRENFDNGKINRGRSDFVTKIYLL